MTRHLPLLSLLLALRVVPAPSQSLPTANASAASASMDTLIYRYQADEESLARKYTLRESDVYYNRMERFYAQWAEALDALRFESFSQSAQVDYLLLKNRIAERRARLQRQSAEYKAIKPLVPFSETAQNLITERQRGATLNGKAVAQTFAALGNEIKALEKSLAQKPKMPLGQAKYAARVVQGFSAGLQEMVKFYATYDPLFTWWTKAPFEGVVAALKNYASALEAWNVPDNTKDDGTGIVGRPIGAEEFTKSLQFAMIAYTPEELIAIGNEEFRWCEKEMLKAAQDMGFGNDWKAALEKVKNDYVAPGEQPALINTLAEEAIEYVEKNNLVTVPAIAKETWRMTMLTAEQQRISPFFLGGEVIQIAFPTADMQHDDKMMSLRGNNKHFARATVFHELIPGHHLQMYMTERYNRQRGEFDTPFWIEGWALYWEMLLWDRKFTNTPEDRVGALFWRMHRCARIIFSINYHLGKWTPKECIDFLVEKVGHERANAEAEVRRSVMGGYGPLYQLAYMIGAKQFVALRKEVVGGGKMTEREFHDAVLQSGNIPIEMVRALLLEQKLTKEHKTSWRFY